MKHRQPSQDRTIELDLKCVCGKVGNMTFLLISSLWPLTTPAIAPASYPITYEQAMDRARDQAAENAELMSQARAKICAMNHDTVTAALWSLSGFDPALVHLAELREHFTKRGLDEEDPLRITLDRLTSVYVEGQCRELLHGAGITIDEANIKVEQMIGDPSGVAEHVLACSSDPLAMELFGYALWLGSVTAHGNAPWNRFAAVMADCFYQRHPRLAGA